jgi:hypothetical protein
MFKLFSTILLAVLLINAPELLAIDSVHDEFQKVYEANKHAQFVHGIRDALYDPFGQTVYYDDAK